MGHGQKWLSAMIFRRGEMVIVLFPDSNLRASKGRPALIVQADGLGAELPRTVVAMITSNMARAGHPSRVNVQVRPASCCGIGSFDGLGNHDRQSRHDSPLGDRSGHRSS